MVFSLMNLSSISSLDSFNLFLDVMDNANFDNVDLPDWNNFGFMDVQTILFCNLWHFF